jgi:hypothetical protein
MLRVLRVLGGSFALVGVVLGLGCASLTRPDGDDLHGLDDLDVVRAEPAVVAVAAPPPTTANPTNEGDATKGTNVALVAAQPQPAMNPAGNPPAAKQGG